ncbi:MAG: protein kinase [Chlamydiales bacterium]|nr:protein kinase [Chlamydiales bacterium]
MSLGNIGSKNDFSLEGPQPEPPKTTTLTDLGQKISLFDGKSEGETLKLALEIGDIVLQGSHSADSTDALFVALLKNASPDTSKMIARVHKVANNLQETLAPDDIKPTLMQTIDHLFSKHEVSQSDIHAETKLTGNEFEAKLKMANRLLTFQKSEIGSKLPSPSFARRMEATGFELSTVKQIEKAFKEVVSGKATELSPTITRLEEKHVTVTRQGVLIEGDMKGSGASKVARSATVYFNSVPRNEQVSRLVAVSPRNRRISEKTTFDFTTSRKADNPTTSTKNKSSATSTADKENTESYNSGNRFSSMVEMEAQDDGQAALMAQLKNRKNYTVDKENTDSYNSGNGFSSMVEMEVADDGQAALLSQLKNVTNYSTGFHTEDEEFDSELHLLQALQGEGVNKLTQIFHLESGQKIWVLEEAQSDLHQHLATKNLNFETASVEDKVTLLKTMQGAFTGVSRMHDLGIIHRDLKPENLLVMQGNKGVVTDFGISIKTPAKASKLAYAGTPHYSAPETFRGTVSEKSDVWSCGMILQDACRPGGLLSHIAIDNITGQRELMNKYSSMNTKEQKAFALQYAKDYPEPAKTHLMEHLIWSCTQLDPSLRPTMKQFCEQFNQIIQETT